MLLFPLLYRDEQLMDKMEKYRDQVERVTISLQECEEKLTGFEIQVYLLPHINALNSGKNVFNHHEITLYL